MPFSAALVLGGANIVGGVMAGNAAKSAANTSAQAQLQAAQIAADAARFRPIGTTTRFGSSQFGFDPTGQLTSAGYTVSPELQQYQDQLQALSQQQIQQGLMAPQQYAPLQGAAGGLFSLGQQYLAQTPEQAAQKYIEQQQNLLAPSRERQYAQVQNQLFNTGRGGLSVGATGLRPSGGMGLSAANPEMEAYYNALAQQDLQLASNAEQEARNRIIFGQNLATGGAGLLGGYYSGQTNALTPFQTSLGLQGSIENLGMTPLQVGAELGGRSATAGANAGRYLLTGGLGAAETMQKANSFSPLATGLRSISGSAAGTATNRYLESQLKKLFSSEPDGGEFGRDTQF